MKKVFLSVLMLAGIAGLAMADHQETLTVTVPSQTEACYAIGSFSKNAKGDDWQLEEITPMDLKTVNQNGTKVFTCQITVPEDVSDHAKCKYKFLGGGQSWDYEQVEGDFFYDQGYTQTVSGFKKYATYGNVVRFTCSAATEKVYLGGKFAGDNNWSKEKMIPMVEVEKTATTKTFQARVGTNETNMPYKYFVGARDWNCQTTADNYLFADMPKDATGAACNPYITVNIAVPDSTTQVYLMGDWSGKGVSTSAALKCAKVADKQYVGIIPSTAAATFKCYNLDDLDYPEMKADGGEVASRTTTDAVENVMNITVEAWTTNLSTGTVTLTINTPPGSEECYIVGAGQYWTEKWWLSQGIACTKIADRKFQIVLNDLKGINFKFVNSIVEDVSLEWLYVEVADAIGTQLAEDRHLEYEGSETAEMTVAYWQNAYTLGIREDVSVKAIMEHYNGKSAVETPVIRTLSSGGWQVMCLPFNVANISSSPLAGATFKKFVSSDISNDSLSLHFADVTSITAGEPYLVKVSGSSIVNPMFGSVLIADPATTSVGDANVQFISVFAPMTINAANAYIPGMGNALESATGATVKALNGYFQVSASVSHVVIDEDETPSGLRETAAGMTIRKAVMNGRVVIMRGDKCYSVLGVESQK